MPRYVILEHDHPHRHWDLMLEAGEVLRTWRLSEPPRPATEVAADPSFDHRLVYLAYEGPVSGGRGCVVRWDAGTFTAAEETAERLVVRLEGERLRGTAVLARADAGGWTFTLREEA
jgi:hypothetical protein